MRTISARTVSDTVSDLCRKANYRLGADLLKAVRAGYRREAPGTARDVLKMIIDNSRIAARDSLALCQDTGYTIVWLEVGQEVRITGGDLNAAVNRGVRDGYKKGYLRASIVADPFGRKNTGTNTPAVIHTSVVRGNRLRITVEIKGGGSENMSRSAMLKPSEGMEAVEALITGWVREAGAKPCPPVVVGVGVGGDYEQCAIAAKKSLLRKIGVRHRTADIARMEKRLLKKINETGIGPAGLGGKTTALDVHVETLPCHIACMPVSMCLDCHAHRVKKAVL